MGTGRGPSPQAVKSGRASHSTVRCGATERTDAGGAKEGHHESLQEGPQTKEKLSRQVGDLELFLRILQAEGVQFAVDEAMVSLVCASGYGKYTLSWRLGCAVHYIDRCSSTNVIAHALLQDGPLVVVADEQTQGRGRLGRVWSSEAGKNILCSLILRPAVSAEKSARCSLLWAAAIAAALELYVKWPNDLVTKTGKKVGGILVELADPAPTLIFGLGLNVAQTEFPDLPQATSLELEARSFDRAALLGMLYQTIKDVALNQNLDAWRARAIHMGQRVQVNDRKGVLTGIREDGALLIDDVPVLAGDVQLIEEGR